MTTTVVSCGIGNVGAIPNMLRRVGESCVIAETVEQIRAGQRIILPGVGSFNAAMRRIRDSGLMEVLDEMVRQRGVPILGICLGMQLMSQGSEEDDAGQREPGFGWIKGRCLRFKPAHSEQKLRIPQMGWNLVSVRRPSPLFDGFDDDSRFYFAHSYYMECDVPDDVVTTTDYGCTFASAVQHENVMGVQFHPEKSHRFGLRLFENFVKS